MKTSIVPIGNSQGIRLPKAILLQCGLAGDVELEVADKRLIIRSARHPRQDWEQAFAHMAQQGEDRLLDPNMPASDWDKDEWEWK